MAYDLVSDLHVDFWNSELSYDWNKNKTPDSVGVIIAGDIADTIDTTIAELNKACDVYTLVLYVDGNHESTENYNRLHHTTNAISKAMESRENFVDLTQYDFIDGKTVFIGACGWWDFRLCEPEISFEEATASMNCEWNPIKTMTRDQLVQNILFQAEEDFLKIKNRIEKYKNDYEICIVTHTVPHKKLVSKEYPFDRRFAPHYGNSLFQSFFEEPSVKHAIYGHNHGAMQEAFVNHVRCLSNPRGRPKDYKREQYKPLVVSL